MKNFLLIFVAIILLVPFGLLGTIYALFNVRPLSDYWRGIAESLDQLGNHVCGPMFNQWMTRNIEESEYHTGESYPFGNIDETVSSALGKNQERGTLTKSGKWLNRLLNKLDKNHSIDAIEENP